jgi:peptidoglycan/LPS O-acetylase OafA/YrhL
MRNRQFDTLRGLACVLLVFYHVVGNTPSSGLRISEGALRWFNDALAYLRMPLFTVLSGLVYGFRPFSSNSQKFLLSKARRLLVPMLVVGTVFALLQENVPGTNTAEHDWSQLHLKPVAHFWFVESLFWVFSGVWLLEYFNCIDQVLKFFMVFACAIFLYLFVAGTPWLSIQGSIYLLPFFLAGVALTRFSWREHLSQPWLQAILLPTALLAVILTGWPMTQVKLRTVWGLIAGLSFCGFLVSLRISWEWLARIGRYSYAIYLFHVFFTAAARLALHKAGVTAIPAHVAFGLLFGLGIPMLVEVLASHNRWSALLLLGKSLKVRAPRTPLPPKDGASAPEVPSRP